jgi:hypothetical protein
MEDKSIGRKGKGGKFERGGRGREVKVRERRREKQ